MEATLRILHGERKDKHIICRRTPPKPGFHIGKVAALDIKFTDTDSEEPVFPRVSIFDPAARGGSESSRMCHVVSEELKGKSITELEEDLLEVEGLDSAQKGHRLQQRVAAISANRVKLVAVSEEAAQKIESGAVKIPGVNDYAVQRVALMKEVDKLAELDVVLVDSGSVIDPEFDIEALCHPSYPKTDKKDIATFARLRQLYKGRLFSFIASEEAYRWLTAQEGSQAKVTVEHKANRGGELGGETETAIQDLGRHEYKASATTWRRASRIPWIQ
ncbi:hypothetical protein CYMTET_40654 [Cymbomonas tetramitiformis]|uniref:Uncharacterized protein n=1 Tax=Cymbomonas tetramitiformis TaxID=36881 RepID=A0AAE0F2S0_9CHLO|nr:hypothetical protein CYMTET_40654 [Cymbomonas tetramitiformis]